LRYNEKNPCNLPAHRFEAKALQSIMSAVGEFFIGTATVSETATISGFLISRSTGESVTTGKSF